MSEVKHEQLEMNFEEEQGGAREVEPITIDQEVEATAPREEEVSPEAPTSGEENKVVAEVVIALLADGQIDVRTPDGAPQLQPIEIETLTRRVYDQLRDIRIATTAIEIFKARLG
jgi:hypothetical protein